MVSPPSRSTSSWPGFHGSLPGSRVGTEETNVIKMLDWKAKVAMEEFRPGRGDCFSSLRHPAGAVGLVWCQAACCIQ